MVSFWKYAKFVKSVARKVRHTSVKTKNQNEAQRIHREDASSRSGRLGPRAPNASVQSGDSSPRDFVITPSAVSKFRSAMSELSTCLQFKVILLSWMAASTTSGVMTYSECRRMLRDCLDQCNEVSAEMKNALDAFEDANIPHLNTISQSVHHQVTVVMRDAIADMR